MNANSVQIGCKLSWKELLAWCASYWLCRLIGLTAIPLFVDEAMYLRWTQQIVREGASPFNSLDMGIPPGIVWLAAPAVRFLSDPMLAGRLTSVAFGLANFLGIVLLVSDCVGVVAARRSAILVLCSSMFAIYDRLALHEAIQSAEVIWLWCLYGRYAATANTTHLLWTAIVALLAIFTKSSILLAIMALLTASLVVDRSIRSVVFSLAVAAGAAIGLLFMSPWASPVMAFNNRATQGLLGSLTRPLEGPVYLLGLHLVWLIIYVTPVPLAFSTLSLLRRPTNLSKRLGIAFLLQFVCLALLVPAKLPNPRYLMVLAPLIVPLSALGLEFIRNHHIARFVFWIGMVAPCAANSLLLVAAPARAILPDTERFQLLSGWPSGHGVSQIVTYMKQTHPDNDYWILVEKSSRGFTNGLRLYLPPDRVLDAEMEWFLVPDNLVTHVPGRNSYLVTNKFTTVFRSNSLELIKEFPKPGGGPFVVRLYRFRGDRPVLHSTELMSGGLPGR